MSQAPAPRPAAALILARDCPHGIEVFLMQRTHQANFAAGAFVFPGGAVDAADTELAACCAGLDDATASRMLNMKNGGLAYHAAAIRECFEESGMLLACDASGKLAGLQDGATDPALAACRKQLETGERTLSAICAERGLRLAADRLAYFAHWIAPPIAPRRFDTRFFVAEAPDGQEASHDGGETIGHAWIRPEEALDRHRRGELELMFATTKILESLCGFRDTISLMKHARGLKSIPAIRTRPAFAEGKRRFLMPGDGAYPEVGKLDREGTGNASCEIVPGVVTRLSQRVRRIASPNPHFMRGPGTNTYLIGAGDEIAVLDPGPMIEEHVQALLDHAGGRIRWILATHTHGDHSPAAALLKAKTGAELIGMAPPKLAHQDQSFQPDRIPSDGERLSIAGCTLRAVHTPGHASNHLCFLLEEEHLLFTGDHIMQGSTVVINPPDGDMRVYMASLRKVQDLGVSWLAPGHGFLMDDPRERIDRLLLHRLAREKTVLAVLSGFTAASIDELLPIVYSDVPTERYAMAARSLLAHLLKLKAEDRAFEENGLWRRA